jgi:hypothetical protein
VPARAIFFGAFNPRRQIWVGFPTIKAILANRIAPGLIDRYLAKTAYSGQLGDRLPDPSQPGNLFDSVPGDFGAHGRFDAIARSRSWEVLTSRHRNLAWAAVMLGAVLSARALMKKKAV